MERATFLKNMVGLFGVAFVPNVSIKEYKKVYLKQVFVRGFRYYEGPKIIAEINKNTHVALVRERNNKYDKKAIAIYFNGHKIGYLPKESNKTLSILMDTELLILHAEITHIYSQAEDWEKVRVAVYALKEIKSNVDLKKIKPYSALRTQKYFSVEMNDNILHIK